jgi:DnaJ-class molecular chaperone
VGWASRAYEAGERDGSVTVLIDLMRRDPTRVAGRIQEMFEHEQVAGPAGYQEFRANIPGIAQLRLMLAKYFDEKGQFGSAARLYARSGAAASQRLSELTESHTCDTCGGSGKITSSAPCPTCGGKGTVVCSHCGGVGFTYEPGSPPCTTCDGKGSVVQEGRVVSCAACGGTGKGKGSVIKKDCAFCSHGQMKCPDCTDGRIKILKECPECHGVGHWTMADHGS